MCEGEDEGEEDSQPHSFIRRLHVVLLCGHNGAKSLTVHSADHVIVSRNHAAYAQTFIFLKFVGQYFDSLAKVNYISTQSRLTYLHLCSKTPN